MLMTALPQALQDLIDAFSRLPGIGRKTATRLAFHLLTSPEEHGENLAKALVDVREKVSVCKRCYNFSETDICNICADATRNTTQICVVEDAQTLMMLEKTNEYRGLYHVLGGVISPLDGIAPDDLRIRELLARLDSTDELILALTPSTEGEATSIYLSRLLKPGGIRVTRLARGIPLGSSLEFVDELTLGKALQTRIEL